MAVSALHVMPNIWHSFSPQGVLNKLQAHVISIAAEQAVKLALPQYSTTKQRASSALSSNSTIIDLYHRYQFWADKKKAKLWLSTKAFQQLLFKDCLALYPGQWLAYV